MGELVEEGLKPVERKMDQGNGFDNQRQQQLNKKNSINALQKRLS
jgi:hypothetical protein